MTPVWVSWAGAPSRTLTARTGFSLKREERRTSLLLFNHLWQTMRSSPLDQNRPYPGSNILNCSFCIVNCIALILRCQFHKPCFNLPIQQLLCGGDPCQHAATKAAHLNHRGNERDNLKRDNLKCDKLTTDLSDHRRQRVAS